MSEKKLTEGEHSAVPISWGVQEIKMPDGMKLKAVIQFQLLESSEKITWSDFFLKKDGTENKKTNAALKACGFKGPLHTFVEDTALDRSTPVHIQISRETTQDGKEYFKVNWVNSGIGGFDLLDTKTAVHKLKGLGLDASFTAPKAKVKNFAENIDNDEIPF